MTVSFITQGKFVCRQTEGRWSCEGTETDTQRQESHVKILRHKYIEIRYPCEDTETGTQREDNHEKTDRRSYITHLR